jgi:hypothetical protein
MLSPLFHSTVGAGIGLALALLPAPAMAAKGQPPASSVKNIVLVHGAFADGTSWSKVIPLLEAKGYHVVAVQNPLTSLSDDVAATKRIIALQAGPVVLVGHSWGGAVITQDQGTRSLRGAGANIGDSLRVAHNASGMAFQADVVRGLHERSHHVTGAGAIPGHANESEDH